MAEDEVGVALTGELVSGLGGPRTMLFQKDVVRDDVGDERYALAIALRALAQRVGVSLTRYSGRVHWDRSTLSRYFSGALVPPAGFVEKLIEDGDQHLDTELTPEVIETVRQLHRRALRAMSPVAADLQELRDQLAGADRASQLLHEEANLLREMLATAHSRAKEQEAKFRSLERSAAAERITHRSEVLRWSETYESVREERDRLRELIAKLEQELSAADRRAADAEERCVELERSLDRAEEATGQAEEDKGYKGKGLVYNAPLSDIRIVSLGASRDAASRLIQLLGAQDELHLGPLNIGELQNLPGIFVLYREASPGSRELMYVGKDERSLPRRLEKIRRKLEGRQGIDLDEFAFSYIYIEDDMSVIAPDKMVINHLKSRGPIPWLNNGFGNMDPGRNRDLIPLRPDHFDALHPINLNAPIRINGPRKAMPVRDLLLLAKENLPYRFRFPSEFYELENRTVIVPEGMITADHAFRILARGLGPARQITAFLGYVTGYEHTDASYPSATRYYRGDEVIDVPPVLTTGQGLRV